MADCPRSAAGGQGGLCLSHGPEWRRAGTPALSAFASSAAPAAAGDAVCRIAGCGFPAWTGRDRTGLCDAHAVRYRHWRSFVRRQPGERDPTLESYIARISSRDGGAGVNLALPAAPLLSLELRFVLQHRHDAGEGLIQPRDWARFVERLNALGVQSLLDRDLESSSDPWTERGHLPARASYARYAWRTALGFRIRCGLADPWEPDVWRVRALPIDQAAKVGHLSALDWRAIGPAWLRQLCKRWARHQLRHGRSTSHVASVRRAILALVEFCELAGWPLDSPGCLTRELFDAFLDHVRGVELGAPAKISRAVGVKQLFEQAHDLRWISLHSPRVYLRGELPRISDPLPRGLPPAIVERLNEPDALKLLEEDERAAMLVLMDCGLRATDTARLKLDAVITGNDGAPYLRYFNHKRRREAVVPLSDRAAEAITAQRASVRERFPECEWLFPKQLANRRGQQPVDRSFVWFALRRWSDALDLHDEHGEPYRPSPHMFRHTYATGLVNRDVDLFAVQSLLDHYAGDRVKCDRLGGKRARRRGTGRSTPRRAAWFRRSGSARSGNGPSTWRASRSRTPALRTRV